MNPGDKRPPKIILASESPRRKEILARLGISFSVRKPAVHEISEYCCPSLVPVINACRKAEGVALEFPSHIVIGADTVIEFEGRILGKPETVSEAVEMLISMSGKKHLAVTSVCIRKIEDEFKCVFSDSTEVEFRNFSASTVMEYVGRVNTLDKAGAYAVQEFGDMLIGNIRGSHDNVVGLPSEKLVMALRSRAEITFTFGGKYRCLDSRRKPRVRCGE
ncbi:MAG: Maf family protein [Victivallales bacterium]